MKLRYRDERVLLVILCTLFILAYAIAYPQHAFYADENSYLDMGQKILEGEYPTRAFNRGPVLPFLVSASYLLGLDPFQVRFIFPLIFGTLFMIVTYFMGKRLCGNGLIPALVVLSFPYIWKWVPFLLADIPLGVFSGLSLLFFYRGIEDKGKFLLYSGVFLALAMLTKFSAIVLIPVYLFYILYRRRLSILKSSEFLKAFAAFLIIFLVAASLTYFPSGISDFNLEFMSLEYYRIPTYYLLNFALVPWSLVFLYGMYRVIRNRKENSGGMFALIAFFTVFIFFNLLVWKEMRFLLFIIPMFAIIVGKGLRDMGKYAKYTVLVLFLIICLSESALLFDASSHVTWGADIMTREILALPGSPVIALDSIYIYNSRLQGRVPNIPDNATLDWIEGNNLDYAVLSVYGEIRREPNLDYYKPMLGPIDILSIDFGAPKSILTWWPDYEFGSGLYKEVNARYPVFKRIQFREQDVFVIYEVA